MKQQPTYISDLMCIKCGSIMPISRYANYERENLQMLKCYCYNCKAETFHMELKDSSYVLAKIRYTDDEKLNDKERLIYSLLSSKNE